MYVYCFECGGTGRRIVEGIRDGKKKCFACKATGAFVDYARNGIDHKYVVLVAARRHVLELRNHIRMMERAIKADDKVKLRATPNLK